MKVLQINSVYKKGSTGKIVNDIHNELISRKIDSVVCYGRGEKIYEPYIYKVCGEFYTKLNHLISNITGVVYGGCYFSTKKIISIIKTEKPDIVHLQCINGYFVNIYNLLNWLKNNKIKTVITLHAEFMFTGGCSHSVDCKQWKNENGCKKCPIYKSEFHSYFDRSQVMWKRMKKAFNGFEDNLIVVSVSPWMLERAKQSSILKNSKHRVVLNGLDTSIFHMYEKLESEKIKKKMGLLNKKIVFHVTPTFSSNKEHLKGGYYVIELAKRLPNISFVIVGAKDGDFDLPKNVVYLGKINDQKRLALLYSMSNITLITSCRETFSMVTAESICCGTPVIGFKSGGPESIALPEYSKFVDYGNLDLLEKEILASLCNDYDSRKISNNGKRAYSKEVMVDNYCSVYFDLLNLNQNEEG